MSSVVSFQTSIAVDDGFQLLSAAVPTAAEATLFTLFTPAEVFRAAKTSLTNQEGIKLLGYEGNLTLNWLWKVILGQFH